MQNKVYYKYKQVYDYLLHWIKEQSFSSLSKIPSENMLCKKFNVSRHTVRKATDRLKKEGYIKRVRGSGTFVNKASVISDELLNTAAKRKVAVVMQGQDRNANSSLLRGLKSAFANEDISLQVFFTDNLLVNERQCLEYIQSQPFCGIIVDGVKANLINPNKDYYERISEKKIPIVFYNNYYPHLPYPRVIVNDKLAAKSLMKLLLENGHKNIAGLFVFDNYQSIEKYNGYISAILNSDMQFHDDFIKWSISDEAHKPKFLNEIVKFLKGIPQCTAIVCCNYMLLKHVINAAKKLSKRIPEDYSVVCFDYSAQDYDKSGISCSVHPGFQIGVEAARQMLRCIKHGTLSSHATVIDPEIYYGNSVAKIKE
ncbi:MAG: GntR family transcriptional regulator [Eubacteriales bacterium]|nr:GntR family transcriptional regulator [Eubacteriales bacterium]